MSPPAPPRGPEVLVVEGGRQAGDPPSAGDPPRLVLAPTPAAEDVDTAPPARFQRLGPDLVQLAEDEGAGRIFVDGSSPEQALFVGEQAGHYRLELRQGAVWVRRDAGPPVILRAGQSLDVQARALSVSWASAERAQGRYLRLPPHPLPSLPE